ncbi:protein-disulfide reductase DsbD domain-containing protein [Paenirhodobacter sp.]|uniref:protein-disulfide reductase DsbD domain-containing protein n=1 Tax=Paenirhodobacter sp. TaxID=1965326 RepID=UPI003B500BFD
MPRLACLLMISCLAQPASAQDALPPGMAGARVLDGWRTPEGDYIAALKIELEHGWKTYWRVPGEAGIPPVLNFAGSENIAAISVIWPAPEVFDQNGMRTVGYHDEMILPLRIRPKNPDGPVRLDADMEIGICRDVCVPVTLDLEAGLQGPGAPNPEIRRAMAAVPEPRPGRARCAAEPIADGMRVTAVIDLPPEPNETALFELRSHPVWVSEPVVERAGGLLFASAEFVPDAAKPFPLDPQDLRITVLSDSGAVQVDGCPED